MQKLRATTYALLRKSEKIFKTDMVYLTSGGFWLFFGQGVTTVAALALAVAFANLIEPEKYGNYKYVLSLAGLVGALTLTGISTALTRASARGFDGTLRYAFRTSLLWSVGMIGVSLCGALYYIWRGNDFLALSLLIIGATAPLISAGSLYRPFLVGKKEFRKAAIYGIIQSALPTAAVLAGIIADVSLISLVFINFATTTAVLTVLYTLVVRRIHTTSVDPATDHISKHLSFMRIFSSLVERADSILVFQLLGGTELAIFTLATTIPDTIRGSFKNIDALAVPKFVKKSKLEMKRAVWSKTVYILLLSVVLAGLYVALAPLIFTTLFPSYLSSIAYSQVYACIIPLSFALASAYFDTQAAVRERYILNISNSLVKLVSIVVGIIWFGIWGAIAARLFARVVNVGLSAFFIARH